MHLLLCVALVLFGFPLGKMFVLHPEEPAPSAARTSRCSEEPEIRKMLLESLKLQQEPRVFVSRMSLLRMKWKATFKTSVPSSAGNSTFLEDSSNGTCCQRSSQVFMKDLGWDSWVVHPESVTVVQCTSCGPSPCSEGADAPAQCCEPRAHDFLPFVYVDEWSSLVLSSVSLIRACGCNPGEVVTPS